MLLFSLLLLLAFLSAGQQSSSAASQKSANYDSVPVAEANKSNPVKPTPESLASGKKQYGYDCAMCHGSEGNGKGDVAPGVNLKMHDYTNPATLKDRTDGELFYIIKNGKGDMPPEGDRVKPEQICNMINYIRSFAKPAPGDRTPQDEGKAPK
jgi:mono/diheme cytochrome c family protein